MSTPSMDGIGYDKSAKWTKIFNRPMLTARDSEKWQVIEMLKWCRGDYVAKPFSAAIVQKTTLKTFITSYACATVADNICFRIPMLKQITKIVPAAAYRWQTNRKLNTKEFDFINELWRYQHESIHSWTLVNLGRSPMLTNIPLTLTLKLRQSKQLVLT